MRGFKLLARQLVGTIVDGDTVEILGEGDFSLEIKQQLGR